MDQTRGVNHLADGPASPKMQNEHHLNDTLANNLEFDEDFFNSIIDWEPLPGAQQQSSLAESSVINNLPLPNDFTSLADANNITNFNFEDLDFQQHEMFVPDQMLPNLFSAAQSGGFVHADASGQLGATPFSGAVMHEALQQGNGAMNLDQSTPASGATTGADVALEITSKEPFCVSEARCKWAGCDKIFTRHSDAQRHWDTIHMQRDKYWCPIAGCRRSQFGGEMQGEGRHFPRKDKRDDHVRKVHRLHA
ncbi:hypothetical protein NA57DRAFT_59330 [Rhizodiscina lignyota]|uniref:C2H2-type domain-containing protein n=1 Tax=Rhizodiscina lignyota TaxID=1504668 RepID=A0A9P4IA53_9PEZI|nr:hypothetical protein NA57DRAFT_59330 [Rhizodiscina lignyota]